MFGVDADPHASQNRCQHAMKMGGWIMGVDDLDVFLPEELSQPANRRPTHPRLFAEDQDAPAKLFDFRDERTALFEADNQELVGMTGKTLGKVDNDALQAANLQARDHVGNRDGVSTHPFRIVGSSPELSLRSALRACRRCGWRGTDPKWLQTPFECKTSGLSSKVVIPILSKTRE